jgi:hypothetical protein
MGLLIKACPMVQTKRLLRMVQMFYFGRISERIPAALPKAASAVA